VKHLQPVHFAGICLLFNLTACSVVSLSDKPAPVTDPRHAPVLLPQLPPPEAEPAPTPTPPAAPAPVTQPAPEPEPSPVPPPPPEPEPLPAPEQTPAPEPTPEPDTSPAVPPQPEAPITSTEGPDSEPKLLPTEQELALPATHSNSPPSLATDPKAYRQDAAKHLYRVYANRIYKGKLPPMLKAIGVVDVLIGPQGQVLKIQWVRPPRQGPELIAQIENMIRRAGPFPAPVNLRKLTYTETWLWDASGRFQLDSLTEGQK
jgi:protein TonB